MTKTRTWAAAGAAAMVVVLLAGWFLLISPKRGEAQDLRDQTTTQQAANGMLLTKLKQLKVDAEQLEAKNDEIELVGKQLPAEPALAALVRQLTRTARDAGVRMNSVTPSEPAPLGAPTAAAGEHLEQVAVTLSVTGSFYELERYLDSLEGMTRLFQVTGFSLVPSAEAASAAAAGTPGSTATTPTGSGTEGDLDLTINGRVFVRVAAPGTTAASGTAGAPAPGTT
ncbi:MAG: type 4a pilus biogenesis protein PilO, partial [Actinomycetota bacterium]|nr:type 4a pilus biogenesis protein PilO [Actinomycetota bacterium]